MFIIFLFHRNTIYCLSQPLSTSKMMNKLIRQCFLTQHFFCCASWKSLPWSKMTRDLWCNGFESIPLQMNNVIPVEHEAVNLCNNSRRHTKGLTSQNMISWEKISIDELQERGFAWENRTHVLSLYFRVFWSSGMKIVHF